MVEFNLWFESFIFAAIFCMIIIVPCVLVALIGRRVITQLGLFPTKAPGIQMSILFQLVGIEIATFAALLIFFRVFENKT